MPDPEAQPAGANAPRTRSRRGIVLALAALLAAGVALGLWWRGDAPWTRQARTPADSAPANPGYVGLVYGAGGSTDEMYFAWEGDRLYSLPVAWLFPLDRWGHAVATAEAREASPGCLECHNTWVAHVTGSSNQYRHDGMILGVTC